MASNTIGDMLDMDFDNVEVPFDVEEGFEYDEWTRFDRTVAFDILWDVLDTYPPTYDDDVVQALIDDTDHVYHIEYDGGTVRETKVMGIAMMAFFDEEATVEVDPDD